MIKTILITLLIYLTGFFLGNKLTDNNIKHITNKITHSDSVVYIEKEIPKGAIPIFRQPTNEDKKLFLSDKDRNSFSSLMDQYFYVPVCQESVIYAFVASNNFKIYNAEWYIYWYLYDDSFPKLSPFIRDIALKHLAKGAKAKESEAVSAFKKLKLNKNGKE